MIIMKSLQIYHLWQATGECVKNWEDNSKNKDNLGVDEFYHILAGKILEQ